MTGNTAEHGFPTGYFVIRSVGSGRMADVEANGGDGAEIILYPEKETSLVEGFRDQGADNQVFFIDPSGALCSRSSGHGIDVQDDRLITRHRRPVGPYPYPNKISHPFPAFRYSQDTGEITVHFEHDPSYPRPGEFVSDAWKTKKYVLASIPMRKSRTVLEDTSEFLTTNIFGPIGGVFGAAFYGPTAATADEVVKGNIELGDDEVVEEERREEDEVDDSLEPVRRIRVLAVSGREEAGGQAQNRRRWIVTALRKSNARVAVSHHVV